MGPVISISGVRSQELGSRWSQESESSGVNNQDKDQVEPGIDISGVRSQDKVDNGPGVWI